METTPGFTLLGDHPCIDRGDSLGFERIATDLAALILSSKGSTPFTIGIEGGWGSGKSSLMGRIDNELRAANDSGKDSKVTTVWFNAWTADDGRVLEGLIKSVLDKLDHNILRKVARKKEMLSWARVALTVVASWLKVDTIVDQIWHKLEVDPQARNEMRDLMVAALDDWRGKRHIAEDHLLVVCIDDLDRCSPENVFQVFEAMKLYLDAPGLVFVVGFDESVVSDAILHEKQYSKSVTSRQYLEKVIQIRYRIPAASDNQSRDLIRAYMSESKTTDLFDDSSQSLVIERNTRNPRRIKRFINGFILEYKVDSEWQQLGAESLVRVLIIYMYFPAFAALLDERSSRDPISEFLDYVYVREVQHRGTSTDGERQEIERVLVEHGIPWSADAEYGATAPPDEETPLARLERELPEIFPELAGDDDFVTLLKGFGETAERDRLWAKLERRGDAAPAASFEELSGADVGATGVTEPSLKGVQVLWVDDRPQGNNSAAQTIERRGGKVAIAKDGAEAIRHLRTSPRTDMIISDITRGDDKNAGFNDLLRIRAETGYNGPVIFNTGRVTPSRRTQAESLNAEITSNPWELFEWIDELAAEPTPEAKGTQPAATA